MDQSSQGQGCEGKLCHNNNVVRLQKAKSEQLSIAEERDRRRANAIAGH